MSKHNTTSILQICQDCLHQEKCELDTTNMLHGSPCWQYTNNDCLKELESEWKEMSYYKYTDNILTWQYDEYADGE